MINLDKKIRCHVNYFQEIEEGDLTYFTISLVDSNENEVNVFIGRNSEAKYEVLISKANQIIFDKDSELFKIFAENRNTFSFIFEDFLNVHLFISELIEKNPNLK